MVDNTLEWFKRLNQALPEELGISAHGFSLVKQKEQTQSREDDLDGPSL